MRPKHGTTAFKANKRDSEPAPQDEQGHSWMYSTAFEAISSEPVLAWDTCSSFHLACPEQPLENRRVLPSVSIDAANGGKISLSAGGDYTARILDASGQLRPIHFKNVYLNPGLKGVNLVSQGILDEKGFYSATSRGKLGISTNPISQNFKEGIFATGRRLLGANIFVFNTASPDRSTTQPDDSPHTHDTDSQRTALYSTPKNGIDGKKVIEESVLHRRLGHPSAQALQENAKHYGVTIAHPGTKVCEACRLAGSQRQPFRSDARFQRHTSPGTGWHLDLFGPLRTKTFQGARYILICVDDYSRLVKIYFLRDKTGQLDCFRDLAAWSKTQTGNKIKEVRTDGEWASKEWQDLKSKMGFEHKKTTRGTPQSNGVAERYGGIIIRKARILHVDAQLPPFLYGEALMHATYLHNLLVHEETSPLFKFSGTNTTVHQLRVHGSLAYARINNRDPDRSEPTALRGVFVGMDLTTRSYRIFLPEEHRLFITRDVTFDETCRGWPKPSQPRAPNAKVSLFHENDSHLFDDEKMTTIDIPFGADATQDWEGGADSSEGDYQPSINPQTLPPTLPLTPRPPLPLGQTTTPIPEILPKPPSPVVPRYSTRHREPSRIGLESAANMATSICFTANLPINEKEALTSPQWATAMGEEFNALKKHEVFSIVQRPTDKRVIGGRWVYAKKSSQSGKNIYKARYVAKGFQQAYGINYTETWSPTVSTRNIRLLFAVAAALGLRVGHLDVKTAFLNATLDEPNIFIELPLGYREESKVMHLKKALYGLKQAGKEWHSTFHKAIVAFNFRQCKTDPCLYYKQGDSCLILFAIHVDDALFTFNGEETQQDIIKHFSSLFEIAYLGDAKFALGLEIQRTSTGYHLSQPTYVDVILKRFGYQNCLAAATPGFLLPPSVGDKASALSEFSLNELAGSLIWLAKCTRPDIAVVTSLVAQQVADPQPIAFQMCSRILRYLQGTRFHGIEFKSTGISLMAYADSDWAGDVTSRKSQSGHVLFLAGGPVNWTSRKQDTVALSTSEAEIVEACLTTTDVLAVVATLEELKLKVHRPVQILEDNSGAIALSETTLAGKRTKHIDIKWHFINDAVAANQVKLMKVPTEDNIADVFTKILARPKFEYFISKLVSDSRHSTSLLKPQPSTADQDGPGCRIPTARGTCKNQAQAEREGKAMCWYHIRIHDGVRCIGIKTNGLRCKAPPRGGTNFCPTHEPVQLELNQQPPVEETSFSSFFQAHSAQVPVMASRSMDRVTPPIIITTPAIISTVPRIIRPRQVEVSNLAELAAVFERLQIGDKVTLVRVDDNRLGGHQQS